MQDSVKTPEKHNNMCFRSSERMSWSVFGSLRQYQDGETERQLQEMKVGVFRNKHKKKKIGKKVVQTTSIQ